MAGAVLATAGLGALVFGLIEAPEAGWGSWRTWGPVAAGAVALFGFAAVELRTPHPMVPLGLFRNRTFAATNLLTLFLYAALAALFFYLPFVLIQARGYTPAASGAAVLPLVVLMSAGSHAAGALADRVGPRLLLIVGPLIAGAGFALFAVLPPDRPYPVSLLPPLTILGIGLAVTVAPLTAAVLNAVDRKDPGSGFRHQQRCRSRRRAPGDRRFRHRRGGDVPSRARPPARRRRRLRRNPPPSRAGTLEARRHEAAGRTRAKREARDRVVGREARSDSSFRRVSLICAALAAAAALCGRGGSRGTAPGVSRARLIGYAATTATAAASGGIQKSGVFRV